MQKLPDEILQALGIASKFETVPLAGYENDNYLVKTAEASFVVKRLRAQHSIADTELEGIYRHYLAASDLPIAPYIPLKERAYVRTVAGDNYVATRYITGKTPKTCTKDVVVQAAILLAKIHSLGTTNLPSRGTWLQENYIYDSLKAVNDTYQKAKKAFAVLRASTPDFWNSNLPQGIIHGDLHDENMVIDSQGNIVSIIDWEEVAIAPLLLDVAYAARALAFSDGVCDKALFTAFIDAYQSVRPLTQLEKDLFQAALQYTVLVLSVWAHTKVSQNQLDETVFQSLGNYYKTNYRTPEIKV
jgi:homoserine kinase type II